MASSMNIRQLRTSFWSTTKTNDKTTNIGRMVSSDISDEVFASVYSKKTHLKKLMMTMKITFIIITENHTMTKRRCRDG